MTKSWACYHQQLSTLLGERIVSATDDPCPASVVHWEGGRGIIQLLDRFLASFPEGVDRRGVGVLWGSRYIARFSSALLGASLVLRHQLPISIEDIQLVISDDGWSVTALRIPHGGALHSKGDIFELTDLLIRKNYEPIISVVSTWAEVAPRVLWSAAASNIYWAMEPILSLSDLSADQAEDFNLLFSSRLCPDGRRNPMFEPVRWFETPDGIVPGRRVCCLIYLLRDGGLCGRCPARLQRLACAPRRKIVKTEFAS